MKTAFFAFLLVCGSCLASEHAQHPHWSYSGETAPSHWSELESDYATCSKGHTQSPIDIRHEAVHDAKLPKLVFNYNAVPLKIIDNGHSIQIDYAPGSFLTVGDHKYQLVQFHFHHPSEEQIDGKGFEMVAHLVHKDAAGKLAVVAVLLDQGAANSLVQTLWTHIPKQKEHEDTLASIRINAADLLPNDRTYYSFTGSLTTPPCTEGVSWFVLRHPNTVSPTQARAFAKVYPMNARPVQAVEGREISSSQE